MSRGRASFLAAVAGLLAILAWVLATRPGDRVRRTDPDVTPPGAAAQSRPATASATAPIRPRSFVEPTETETRAATRAEGLTVSVLDEFGAGVEAATVGLGLPGEVEWHRASPEQRTDIEGKVAFGGMKPPPSTEVFVIADGYPPVREKLAAGATEHVVRLSGGDALSGYVTVDGAPPAKRLTFMVRGFEDPTSEWPQLARHFLSKHEWGESRMKMTTRAGGSLSLRGVASGQIVRLELPSHLRLREPATGGESTAVTVTTPRGGLVLDLVSIPVITGRAVLPPNSPLKLKDGVSISYTIRHPRGTTESGRYVPLGTEFSIPIEIADATGVTVNVLGDFGILATRSYDGTITSGVAFGDIVLDAGRRLNAVLQDVSDAPIAGGRIAAEGQVSAPTGSDGRTTIPLTLAAKTLLAGAYGYRLRRIPLGETLPDPLVVVLEASNRLIVEVRFQDGSLPPSSASVELAFSRPMEADAPENLDDFADVRGTPNGSTQTWATSAGTSGYEIGYPLNREGQIAVSDLPASESIGVKVKDRYEHELVSRSVELGPTETKALQLVLPRKPRTVAATVTDAKGASIGGVEVQLGGGHARTDARGAFSFPDVLGEARSLTLSAPGYATLMVEGSEVFTRSRYVLEEGRSVWVQVVDASGAPTQATVTFVLADGTKLIAVGRSAGSYEVERAPARPASVEAKAGDEVASVAVGADQNQVRIVLRR